jgi:hypothetical protein
MVLRIKNFLTLATCRQLLGQKKFPRQSFLQSLGFYFQIIEMEWCPRIGVSPKSAFSSGKCTSVNLVEEPFFRLFFGSLPKFQPNASILAISRKGLKTYLAPSPAFPLVGNFSNLNVLSRKNNLFGGGVQTEAVRARPPQSGSQGRQPSSLLRPQKRKREF